MKRISSDQIVLTPLDDHWNGAQLTRACRLQFIDNGQETRTETLWFRFETARKFAPEKDNCDSYLLCMMLDAMHQRRDIIINGNVSRTLLSNLTEWQAIFNHWFPDDYAIIGIHPRNIVEEAAPAAGTTCAFSGGLDSLYTVWTHSQKLVGFRSQDISFAVLAHGFDIPLEETERFESARAGGQDILDDLDIKLRTIATNYRELSDLNWEHTHGCVLVGTLKNYSQEAGTCLLGSSYVYNKNFPLGSSPVTDHLLGSDSFRVIHDAAAVKRTDKAASIAEWQHGANRVRVCYKDTDAYNCCKCFKCMGTAMAFAATGSTVPESLDGAINDKAIRSNMLYHDNEYFNLGDTYRTARENKVREPWVNAVQYLLVKSRFRRMVRKGKFTSPDPEGPLP